MDWLMTPNIVMPLVILAVIVFSFPLFYYRSSLNHALKVAFHPDVQRGAADDPMFHEHFGQARTDYLVYSTMWVPAAIVSIILLVMMWTMMSYHLDITVMSIISAALVAGIISRAVTYDHSPVWMIDWQYCMQMARDNMQRDRLNQQSAILTAEFEHYQAIEKSRPLTEEELIAMADLMDRLEWLALDFDVLAESTLEVQVYFKIRRDSLKTYTRVD